MTTSNPYPRLRDLALGIRPHQLGLPPDWAREAPYGVVMDMGLGKAVATLTSFLSGDASLYYSTGGGVLGGMGHPALRGAAKAFVRVASDFLHQTTKTSDHPLPATGHVYFYLVTPDGWRRAEAKYAELMTGQDALTPLFAAGQEVITQFRKIEEAQAKQP